jgi:hypothetical protein
MDFIKNVATILLEVVGNHTVLGIYDHIIWLEVVENHSVLQKYVGPHISLLEVIGKQL